MGKRKKNKIVNTLRENDLKAADILIKYAKEKEESSKKDVKESVNHDVNYASNLPKIASKETVKVTNKVKDKTPEKKELPKLNDGKPKNNSTKKEDNKAGKSLFEIEKALELEKTLKLNKKILKEAIDKSKPIPKKTEKKNPNEVKKDNNPKSKENSKVVGKELSKTTIKEENKEISKNIIKEKVNEQSKNTNKTQSKVSLKNSQEIKKDEVVKKNTVAKTEPKKTLEQATGAKEVKGTKKSLADSNRTLKNSANNKVNQPKTSEISKEDMLEAEKILKELDADFENRVIKKKEELSNKSKNNLKEVAKDGTINKNKIPRSAEAQKNLQDTVDILKELNQAIDKKGKAKKSAETNGLEKKTPIEEPPQVKSKKTNEESKLDLVAVKKDEKASSKVEKKSDVKVDDKKSTKEEAKEVEISAEPSKEKAAPKKEKKKINIAFNIVSVSCLIFAALGFILLFYRLLNLNMLPVKYLATGIGIFVVVTLIFILMIISKSKVLHIIQVVLSLILGCVFAYVSTFVKNYDDVFKDLFKVEDTSSTYYVVTLAEDEISSIDGLNGLKVGLLDQSIDKIKDSLSTHNLDFKVHDSIGQLTYALDALDDEDRVRALIICSSVYDYLAEEDKEFFGKIKKIYEFDIYITSEELALEEKKEEVASKPPTNILENVDTGNSFIVYISGIDGGGEIRAYGLSDVNILAVVNPDTHKILLVSTPRDYYIQVAGTTGLKDKLTHAGLYGINTSIKTMNNLYGIKIDYYAKVTFGALVTVVDDIDGIDVYSDTAFNSFHMNGWYVNQGMNHMDGKKALAYSRERYAYAGGDRHRIKNQQDVMGAIVKKVATNKSYLLKFNDILNHIQPYFTTNIPYEKMQEVVKEQLDTLRPWNIINVSVNGTNSSNYTASWPKQLTYVMIPTQSTIEEAQQKIVEVMRVN